MKEQDRDVVFFDSRSGSGSTTGMSRDRVKMMEGFDTERGPD